MDSGVGSSLLLTPAACRIPQEFKSPLGQGPGLLQPLCNRAQHISVPCGTGRSTRVVGRGLEERVEGLWTPNVNSVQTRALSSCLVTGAVPVAGSSMQ